jgi:hypothetical protein
MEFGSKKASLVDSQSKNCRDFLKLQIGAFG